MRPDWDTYFMQLARLAAERSTCPRRHVGAILVKDNHVISTGYNGSAPGDVHCDDVGCDMGPHGSCVRTIHAEINAITRVTRRVRSGATMYCTDFPCPSCADYMVSHGVAEIVYEREYRDNQDTQLALFEEHGIVCRKYQLEEVEVT